MRIVTVPLNEDNFGYILIHEATGNAAVVDVSNQPERIATILAEQGLNLKMVLTTHKHWDHANGNNIMKEKYPDIEIIGSEIDNPEGCTKYVTDSESLYLEDIKITCILTPGHTMGHVCYFVQHNEDNAVFTGDILFIGGVGKFFEGTADDMYGALGKLTALPQDTQVYCGHEYTLSNYRFALSIDGCNSHLAEANERMSELRQQSKPTVPSTIGQEINTNPFLRVEDPAIMSHFPTCSTPIEVLAAVREAKNRFK